MAQPKFLPDCWGHRGASTRFPENTLASFEAAIQDGAEGIESDNVVVMFHDPTLGRTTDSTGNIKDRLWYGQDGMEHVRTRKEPKQSIPTFAETIALLMKPENQHVKFNVDVKVQNDPDRLFTLMNTIITSQPQWETLLAPRILMGLWHPRFLPFCKEKLPYCRRSYIGRNLDVASKYFWDDCDTFSVNFCALATADGQKFMRRCKDAGKKVMVWTVNEPARMTEAVRWGVDIIITDTTKTWLDLRAALNSDYERIMSQYSRLFLWTAWELYSPAIWTACRVEQKYLERIAGPFRIEA